MATTALATKCFNIHCSINVRKLSCSAPVETDFFYFKSQDIVWRKVALVSYDPFHSTAFKETPWWRENSRSNAWSQPRKPFFWIVYTKANLMHNVFLVYFVKLTCFGRIYAHHQEVQPYVYNNWYLLLFLDGCLLSWLDWNNPTRTTDNRRNILRVSCASSWFLFTLLYRDARSAK